MHVVHGTSNSTRLAVNNSLNNKIIAKSSPQAHCWQKQMEETDNWCQWKLLVYWWNRRCKCTTSNACTRKITTYHNNNYK